jgi:sentrin-specific protease 1
VNLKNKNLSLNEKSKTIKKNNTFFLRRIFENLKIFSIFKFFTNKRKMIKEKESDSYSIGEKDRENINVQNSSSAISKVIDSETDINNKIEKNNNKDTKLEKEMHKQKQKQKQKDILDADKSYSANIYHFWRSNSNPIESGYGSTVNSEINTENNITENNEVNLKSTSNSLTSLNRVLLSESYPQSNKTKNFNSLSNIYSKNSKNKIPKYLSDTSLKYNKKSSNKAYKAVAWKYYNYNKPTSSNSNDFNNYKDLLINTKEAYSSSKFIIPKKNVEVKRNIMSPKSDDELINEINEKIKNSLILDDDQTKFKEPKREYYNELLYDGKLIDEKIKKILENKNKNFPKLSDEIYDVIDYATGPGLEDEVLTEKFNIPIKRHDIRSLIDGEWLNDEIINFYGQLIMERSANTSNKYPSIYFFNTFFFSTLRDIGYRGVRRWTKKVNLFQYDYVIIPIHLGYHWVCSAINFKKKRFEYYDSLHGGPGDALRMLRDYIQNESKDKNNYDMDLSDWEDYCPKDIPSQLNGYDCGVFTLLFAEYLSRKENFDFTQNHMKYMRKKIIYEILSMKLLIT